MYAAAQAQPVNPLEGRHQFQLVHKIGPRPRDDCGAVQQNTLAAGSLAGLRDEGTDVVRYRESPGAGFLCTVRVRTNAAPVAVISINTSTCGPSLGRCGTGPHRRRSHARSRSPLMLNPCSAGPPFR